MWTDFDGLKFTFLIKSRKSSTFKNDKLFSIFDDSQPSKYADISGR